jgi:hypothetical protein
MSRGIALAIRAEMTRTAVAVALIGMVATGTTVLAHATPEFVGVRGTPALLDDPNPGAPTGPDDPLCARTPLSPVCQGGPYAPPPAPAGLQNPQAPGVQVPTSPTDPMCASMPGYGVCQGGPFAPPISPAGSPPGEPGPPPPPAAPAGAPDAPMAPPAMAPIAPPPMAPHIGDMGGMHDIGGDRR